MAMKMNIPAGITSPPMTLGQMSLTDSCLGSSPVKSQSSSNSDVDSAIGERKPSMRQSKPRSKNGCWTCRQRKVKCDEVRPKCGSCTRLNKECEWGQRWKFDNLSIRTQRRNKHVSTDGSPPWDDDAKNAVSLGQLQFRNANTLPAFTDLGNEDEREKKAATRPPGTFNVILTPESFARLPEYGGLIKRYRSGSGNALSISAGSPRDDPNLVILTEFEDTPYFMGLPERRANMVNLVAQVSYVPTIQRDITNPDTYHLSRFILHFRDVISKKIMPLGSKFKLGGAESHEDLIVRESRSFQPLSHAICAITMLSLALKGQRQYLAGAFQHYHQAISACMSCTSMPSSSLLYLHFILLLYDICCASQKCSPDGQMWAQHLQHLARLTYAGNGVEFNEMQAYLLWYTLNLDAQSCLAGNTESGSYVQAYQAQGSVLPTWRKSLTTPQHKAADDSGVMAAVFNLSNYMCNRFAALSQLALSMRADIESGRGNVSDCQRCISEFRNELTVNWGLKYPTFLPRHTPDAGASLPVLARTVFDFAAMQYSTSFIYSCTSMYPGQRMHMSTVQRKHVAAHCKIILSMAGSAVAANKTEQHHIVLPVFLAGFASTSIHDKNRAIGLIRAMEGTGISNNVTKTRELLEAVCIEQRNRSQLGGFPGEVDWISFAREHGFRTVNLGL